MSTSRIFPNWEQIEEFKNPLTDGELELASYLDKALTPDWNIYVQPYMSGDRPDIAIINKAKGVMFFEVKDWSSGLYTSEFKSVRIGRNWRKIRKVYVKTSDGIYPVADPYKQVDRYRKNLFSTYLPFIGESIDRDKFNLGPFKNALYFHNMGQKEANQLMKIDATECLVLGNDSLTDDNIIEKVYGKWRKEMSDMWYNEVSTLLKPPYHAIEQGQKIKLNQKQKQISKPLSNTHMRVRGVAGSGKTLVLAQRAADLANNGMNVLVVTFNITIWHYVRDMVSRARYGFSWEKISFDYYHNFCKSFLLENDVDIPWPSIKGESPTPKEIEYEQLFFSQVFPQLVIDTYDSGKNRKNRKYDAIIIDEGQDFNKIFYHSLTKFLSENDELLIAFDNRQNIFERDASWLENAKDTRFRGKWRELNECYRLPEEILISLNNFAEKFIPEASQHPVPQQYQTEAFIPKMVWQNTKNYNSAEKVIETAVDWLMFKKKCHPSDIIILTPNHKEGMQLVRTFNRKSNRNRIYSVNHVFSDNPRWDKRNKKSFWMGDGRLKMSTIHSFKGWELLNIVLLTPEGYGKDEGNIDSLMYTAMSRTLQNLVVVNRMDKYWDYGKSWDTKFS